MASTAARTALCVAWSSLLWSGCTAPAEPTPPVRRALIEVSDALESKRPPAANAPHVVFVIGCTIRRDQVTPYGGPPGLTPALSDLAKRGVLLEDPIGAAPWTRAASVALLSGNHALSLGVVEPGPARNDHRVPRSVVMSAESFRAAGYTTVGVTANPNLNAVFGFEQGFDHYLQPPGLWREKSGKIGADKVVPEVLAALDARKHSDRPVYLQVMLVDAHAPHPKAKNGPSEGAPPNVNRYREALRAFDAGLASLKTGLEQRGLTDENTLFVVTSDHGEGLSWPEHHGRSHGRYLYSSASHTIGLVVGPGIPAGRRVPGLVSGVDFYPTLLSLSGHPLPEYTGPGIDLSGAVRGTQPTTGRTEAVADTWFMTANRAAIFSEDTVCMRSFRDEEPDAPTGIFRPGCYDRRADPNQERVLAQENRGLMAKLEMWRSARAGRSSDRVEVDPDLASQLEALGYTEK